MKLVSLLMCVVDITRAAETLFPTLMAPKATPQMGGMGNLVNFIFPGPPLDNLLVLETGALRNLHLRVPR